MIKNGILLVEDDDLDVISVERSLKKIGLDSNLYTAYNGIEALNLLDTLANRSITIPEVILLDMNMPKMNGIEFLRKLRNDERFKHLKVFVMTTSNDENERKEAETLGISGYLIKPLNFNDNSKRNASMDYFMHFHLLKIINDNKIN